MPEEPPDLTQLLAVNLAKLGFQNNDSPNGILQTALSEIRQRLALGREKEADALLINEIATYIPGRSRHPL